MNIILKIILYTIYVATLFLCCCFFGVVNSKTGTSFGCNFNDKFFILCPVLGLTNLIVLVILATFIYSITIVIKNYCSNDLDNLNNSETEKLVVITQ